MKLVKRTIIAILSSCMIFSITAVAQTSDNIAEKSEIMSDEVSESMIPWYDVLGISLEQLREEMAQNQIEQNTEYTTLPNTDRENVDVSSLSPEEKREHLSSLTSKELASLLTYDMTYEKLSPEEEAFKAECPQKHTPSEAKEIRKRLLEVKHPDDLICSYYGEIYLDTSGRNKSVSCITNYSEDDFVQFYDDNYAISSVDYILGPLPVAS